MSEPFRYQLIFDTALNPQGADAAEAAVRRVDDAAAVSADGAVAREMRALEASLEKARMSAAAHEELSGAMMQTTASSQTFTDGLTEVTRSASGSGRELMRFSRRVAGSNTELRGLATTIPMITRVLGGATGLAGMLSIAAVGAGYLVDQLGRAENAFEGLGEKVDEVARNVGEMETERIAEMTRSLRDAWDAADAVRQGFEEAKKAADAFASAALDNAGKRDDAERLVAEALGMQVDAFEELNRQAEREAERRRLAAEQAIRQELDAIARAQEQVELAVERRDAAVEAVAQTARELELEREKLGELEAQNLVLERQRKEKISIAESLAEGRGGFPGVTPTDDARAAAATLDDPAYQAELEAMRARVDALAAAVEESGSSLNRQVVALDVIVRAAQTRAEDQVAAAALKIEELRETLDADEMLSGAQLAVDQGRALAKGLGDVVGEISAGNEQQAAAKRFIEKAAADGKITADELVGLGQNLTALVGGLQAGLSTSTESTAQVIGLMRGYQSEAEMLRRELDDLKRRFEGVRR